MLLAVQEFFHEGDSMLVMDFDGTCTDAEEEGKPFTQA
jgi:hypothetical protein